MYRLTNKQWEVWQPQYKSVPLMRCVIAYILGVFFAGYFQIYFNLILPLFILFSIISILIWIYRKRITEWVKTIYGFLVLVFLFLFGFHNIYLGREDFEPNYFGNLWKGKQLASIQLLDIPKQGNSYLITRAKVLSVDKNSDVKGEVYVLIKSQDFRHTFQVNDILDVSAQLAIPLLPTNPYQFDFKKYLFNKHLYHEIFIQKENLLNLRKDYLLNFYELIKSYRAQLIEWVKQFDFSKEEFSVANSLLFGFTGDLTEDVYSSYSNTGVMHVLSVSGLHVGIIYIIINMLLQKIDASMTTRFRHFVVIFVILWLYAMLSGMSPSIVRSALMFSMLKFSESVNNRAGPFHTYFACLFAMLLYDAYYLFDVGFQLSFCAVYGILYFQPKFKSWFSITKKYQVKIMELISVTLAAQIATIPISLYYFHQFPNYFIITNAIIVPISSLVMVIGLVFVSFSAVPFLGQFLFYIFKYALFYMNALVKFFNSLPFSSTSGIYFDTWYFVLLCTAIVFLIFFLERRSMIALKLSLVCIMLIFASEFISKCFFAPKKLLTFYSSNEGFVAEHYENGLSTLYFEKSSSSYGTFERTFLKGNRIQNRINRVDLTRVTISESIKSHFCSVGGKCILIIDSIFIKKYKFVKPIHVDLVYLKHFKKKNFLQLNEMVKTNAIILDKKLDYRARKFIKRNYNLFLNKSIVDLKEHAFIINV